METLREVDVEESSHLISEETLTDDPLEVQYEFPNDPDRNLLNCAQQEIETPASQIFYYSFTEEDELLLIMLMIALMVSVMFPLLMIISPVLLYDSPTLTLLVVLMALMPAILLSSSDFRGLLGELLDNFLNRG
ncbi:uncharacterized protein LOC126740204 [Anthonomus grandis grandis]|uniref:uncharacterized protein LOC126740204 n=1 Tax=Anthonomus grandis grandis TaxID=2921223 RepID=UPI00216627A5|nr:uncharacterized protein LOC126740204 [Anthonomus grandis grandis]